LRQDPRTGALQRIRSYGRDPGGASDDEREENA